MEIQITTPVTLGSDQLKQELAQANAQLRKEFPDKRDFSWDYKGNNTYEVVPRSN